MAKVKDSSPLNPPWTPPPLPVCCDGSQQVQHKEPSSRSSNYIILRAIGEGVFGKVTRSLKLDTNEIVAVKIIKRKNDIEAAEEEVSMLKILRCLDPDKCHIVKFYERFLLDGQTCLVFEMLDFSLLHCLKQRKFPLQLNDIRSIIQQMATAFQALKSVGVIHTDVKPDNIMLVDHVKKPFRVKLIDFGLAILRSEAKPDSLLQPIYYRSPEIILGLPFSEAIDMWSLSCVMSRLFFRYPLFPGRCEYDMMRFMVDILGQPANHLLTAGLRTKDFFTKNSFKNHKTWRLKTPVQYVWETGIMVKDNRCYNFRSLDELTELNLEKKDRAEVADRREFVHLLKQMLQMDASERITPSEVLAHPFITMSHLTHSSHSSHTEAPPPAFEPSSSQDQCKDTKKRTKLNHC